MLEMVLLFSVYLLKFSSVLHVGVSVQHSVQHSLEGKLGKDSKSKAVNFEINSCLLKCLQYALHNIMLSVIAVENATKIGTCTWRNDFFKF